MAKATSYHNDRVLVIDDNEAIHDDFRKVLAKPGKEQELQALEESLFGDEASDPNTSSHPSFDLTFASQGREGVAKAHEACQGNKPFAAAFVDMRMPPGWDGLETIMNLWRVDPDLQVVICTAYSDYSWREIVNRVGHSDQLLILKKPFDNVEVAQLAMALTEKWMLAAQARLKLDQLEDMVTIRTQELQLARDELIAANRIKSEFLANISHEVRTPIHGILGFADFLLDEPDLEPGQTESVQLIKDSANNLMGLITQTLDLAQVESTVTTIDRLDFDLELMLFDVCDSMRRRLQGSSIPLTLKMESVPQRVKCDPTRLRQILINLLDNAIKFTGDGAIELKVTTSDVIEDAHELVFEVTDTGIGIPHDKFDIIFDAFRQVDGSVTRSHGGAGLGLAVVRRLVSALGGDIIVRSVVGQGSTFSFTAQALPAGETPPAPTLLSRDELTMRPLVLCGSGELGHGLAQKFSGEWGMKVTNYPSFLAASLDIEAGQLDKGTVLVDLTEPDSDNFEILARCRAQDEAQSMRYIAVSSETSPGIAKVCHDAGFDGYLPKPLTHRTLGDAIRLLGSEGFDRIQHGLITRHQVKEMLLAATTVFTAGQELADFECLKDYGTGVHSLNAELAPTPQWTGAGPHVLFLREGNDGTNLVDLARKLTKHYPDVPLIVCPADVQNHEKAAYLAAGATAFAPGPPTKESLVALVRSWSTA